MPQHIEIKPASHFTIGTIGEPGNRTFYVQGGRGSEQVSLVIEKFQANILADEFEKLLETLLEEHDAVRDSLKQNITTDMRLREPIETLFRVGKLGLAYNEENNLVVLVAYELVEEEDDANLVSFWTTPVHIKSVVEHTRQVVKGGRPVCGNCGQPMDKSGHFCPHRNGYLGPNTPFDGPI